MKVIIWILKIYLWLIFAWVILSWLGMIPGVASLRNIIGIVVWPVIRPFSILNFGGLSIAPVIPAFILYWVIGTLENRYGSGGGAQKQFNGEP